MVEFRVPINLVIRLKNIEEDEIENYVASIQLALHEVFSSSDPEDDHYEVAMCQPDWLRIVKEVW